jgi:hypothetical protein
MAAKSVDYNTLQKEKEIIIQRTIAQKLAAQSTGKIDSLKHSVLSAVVRGDYERAHLDLDRYAEYKSHFPAFKHRTESLNRHCKELVDAIQAKRNLPGLASLNVSRQQEMLDHVLAHFEDLKQTVKQIERIAKDCALEDLRSTSWALRTICYVVISIIAAAFLMDFHESLGQPFVVVFNDFSDKLFNLLVNLI